MRMRICTDIFSIFPSRTAIHQDSYTMVRVDQNIFKDISNNRLIPFIQTTSIFLQSEYLNIFHSQRNVFKDKIRDSVKMFYIQICSKKRIRNFPLNTIQVAFARP